MARKKLVQEAAKHGCANLVDELFNQRGYVFAKAVLDLWIRANATNLGIMRMYLFAVRGQLAEMEKMVAEEEKHFRTAQQNH